jgi:AcrR family transcriptional regulator
MGDLLNTRDLIFDTFIEMTSEQGYENVSMRDIAQKVGIHVASIYNYFEAKADMLECAYDYHARYQYENRTPIEHMKLLVETASAEDLIRPFIYTYETGSHKHFVRMVLITKIIYMRLFQDPMAYAAFADGNNRNREYIMDIMRHGINARRIEPDFNISTFADVLIGAMQILAIKGFAKPDYKVGQFDQLEQLLEMLGRLLKSAMISTAASNDI